jgi:hypothetical protein
VRGVHGKDGLNQLQPDEDLHKGEALETKIISSMQVRSFNIKSILRETMSFRKEAFNSSF